jgi:hypothetical protein
MEIPARPSLGMLGRPSGQILLVRFRPCSLGLLFRAYSTIVVTLGDPCLCIPIVPTSFVAIRCHGGSRMRWIRSRETWQGGQHQKGDGERGTHRHSPSRREENAPAVTLVYGPSDLFGGENNHGDLSRS